MLLNGFKYNPGYFRTMADNSDDEDDNPLANFPAPPDELNSLELWVVRTKTAEKDQILTAFRALCAFPNVGRREPDDDDVARARRCIYVPAYDPDEKPARLCD